MKFEGRRLQLMNLRNDISCMELMRVHKLSIGIPVDILYTKADIEVAAIAPSVALPAISMN